jgi:glycerophosphoryl diester phosphodiesterase
MFGADDLDASPRHVTFLAPFAQIHPHRRVMRNAVRALKVMIAAGVALVLVAPAAQADVLDQIVVAHRAGATSTYGEGTLASYKHSVANHADILDGDIHWTKDSRNDSDKLGSILIIHDSTLDRITNCKGKVSSWLWTSIRDKCRTDIGKQRLIRLKDLVGYANSVGKPLAIGLKNAKITNAQAKQLWNTIKSSKIQLEAPSSRLAVSAVKKVGIYFHAELSVPASVMRKYKDAGIRVFLFTGKDEADYAKMAARNPYGVVVNDVERFQAWRNAQT